MADELKNCINQRVHGFYSNRIHTAGSVWITDTITNVMIHYNTSHNFSFKFSPFYLASILFTWACLKFTCAWKLRRLPESTLFTEAELSCENAATSFSAASAPRATFSAASKVCSSVSSFFCVSLLRRPQTKRSRKASFRWVPNWQVEARCFRLAANALTLLSSRCVQLWNRYLWAITSFFGAKWFFSIVVSCAYVFSEGGVGEQRSERTS